MWNRIDLYKGLNVCLEIKKYMAGQHVGKQDVFQDMMMFIRCILRSSFFKKISRWLSLRDAKCGFDACKDVDNLGANGHS